MGCDICGEAGDSIPAREKIEKEAKKAFGEHILESDYIFICDKCREKLMKIISGGKGGVENG